MSKKKTRKQKIAERKPPWSEVAFRIYEAAQRAGQRTGQAVQQHDANQGHR